MKLLLLLTSLFYALIPLVGASATSPNIVIILTDDMGWKDVGYHGAEFPTPNIDRIAREGVELDQYYVTPLCSPTRAGLMTGRYPIRYGLQRVTVKTWGTRAIPDDEVMIPASLKEVGYKTRAITGKWHLGWLRKENHPLSKGFTSFLGHAGGSIGFFNHMTLVSMIGTRIGNSITNPVTVRS